MDKEKLLQAANAITNPLKQKEEIYMLMDALGLSYKRTNCGRCLKDYLNIVKEELKMIKNAAEESEFNAETDEWEYIYIHPRTVLWKGHKINQSTPKAVVDEFIKEHPKGFYTKQFIIKENNDSMITLPFNYIAENNAVHNVVENVSGVPFPAGLPSTEETNDNDNDNEIVEGE